MTEILTLRQKLPRGWAKKLSERIDRSEHSIRNVLYGRRTDSDIIDAAIILAEEYQAEQNQLRDRIKNLES